MKTKTNIKARNLPFTVVATVNGIKVKKRFSEPTEAWRYMSISGGQLSMAFRVEAN